MYCRDHMLLCCPGPLEAASNAETSLTQIVQQFTIRAQVVARRPGCRVEDYSN